MGDAIVSTWDEGRSSVPSDFWTVHQGDARQVSALLSKVSGVLGSAGKPFLQSTITSPPYSTLVDYGSDGQIGYGQSHAAYLESCRDLFGELYRWTLDTGSMWVVADSLMEKASSRGSVSRLVPLPFELAAQAESEGWVLREVIIWRKDRTRPWSHRGKFRNGFEYVLFFVKSKDFVFNVDRLRDTSGLKSWWVKYPERHNPWGMTPDNVWEIPIPIQGSWDRKAFRHACPFPDELVRRMVELSSDEGDVVFDPFAGTGAVVRGANQRGRLGFGLELNDEFVSRFKQLAPSETVSREPSVSVSSMTQRLLELRMLKYPKDLAKQILREGIERSSIRFISMEVVEFNYDPHSSQYGEIDCSVVVADGLSEVERARVAKAISEVTSRAPLSKYGLKSTNSILDITDASRKFDGANLFVYSAGRTWSRNARLSGSGLSEWAYSSMDSRILPIVSTLEVVQSLEESS